MDMDNFLHFLTKRQSLPNIKCYIGVSLIGIRRDCLEGSTQSMISAWQLEKLYLVVLIITGFPELKYSTVQAKVKHEKSVLKGLTL